MKTYIALHCTRKDRPTIVGTVQAENLREAVVKMDYWPFCWPDDFIDEHGNLTKTKVEALDVVIENVTEKGYDDGYWNLYLEVDPQGTAKIL